MSARMAFRAFQEATSTMLVDREDEVELVLLGLLTRENVLLVGPPGCAKSMTLDLVVRWLGGRSFSILLTKFTTPDEVFGPIDLVQLQKGSVVRDTEGYLPTAELAFLDEVFKGSSAVLNSMLKILNERTYRHGKTEIQVPLRVCLAASNEWPDPEENLHAAFDRFLFRKKVGYVRGKTLTRKLLRGVFPDVTDRLPRVSSSELDQVIREVGAVRVGTEAEEALEEVLRELEGEGVTVSDRRKTKALKVARAACWLDGGEEVETKHLLPLQHVLWDDPVEQPRITARVVGRVAAPALGTLVGLLTEADEVVEKCDVRKVEAVSAAEKKLKDCFQDHESGKGLGWKSETRA